MGKITLKFTTTLAPGSLSQKHNHRCELDIMEVLSDDFTRIMSQITNIR